MFSLLKKYTPFLIIICLFLGVYFLFFYTHWGLKINGNQIWKFSIQPKEILSSENVRWYEPKSKEKITLPKYNKPFNLFFQTNFTLTDFTRLTEGIVEFGFNYTVKIVINGKEYITINKDLITPATDVKEPNSLPVGESWREKQIKLSNEFLKSHLKNGENTITLIFYDITDLETIDCTQKKLLFLTKGQNNKLRPVIRLRKPKYTFEKSKLPIFKIYTHNKTILDEPKIKATLSVINTIQRVNSFTDPSINYNVKIEMRGRTSQSFAKKSYGVTLYSKNHKKNAQKLIDLPPSKKWVLYGPFADKSLIRNALTYTLYSQMGNYSPRFKFIDLVINNNYQGIYMLTEKIQISPFHVNIPILKMNKKDSTKFEGGYLIDIDRYNTRTNYPPRKDSNSTSSQPVAFSIYSPKKKKIRSIIRKRINTQFDIFEQHVYEKDSMYNFLDINSFIDYLIITEVSKNIDGYRLSTFMYNKDINSNSPKFYTAPIWDYNFSFGLADYHEGYNPEGYVYNADKYVPFWWSILLQDETFDTQLKNRYSKLRKTTLAIDNINKTIDSLYTICESSSNLNFKKWDVLNSTNVWPNYYYGKRYKDEIDYLKNWIKLRLTFLDKDLLKEDN